MSHTAVSSLVVETRAARVAEEMRHAAATQSPRSSIIARSASLAPHFPVEVPSASPIHTPRFSLRPLALRDRSEFQRVLRVSPHTARFMPLTHAGERVEAAFARQLAMSQLGHSSGLAWRRVAVNAAGRIVGGFNLINIERGLAWRADANWWVAGDCLRQRIATECVYAMLDLALGDAPTGLGLHEVHAHVQLENQPSTRLAARVGLRDSGDKPQTLQVGQNWLLHRSYLKSALDRA